MTFMNPSPSTSAAGTSAKRMWHGVYTASVVSTQDPLRQSRVTLKIPQVLGTSTSNWATPVGFSPVIPVVNQVVWAMFLGGDINHPLYMFASTTNTPDAVPSLPNVPVINNTSVTNSTIDNPAITNGTLSNPVVTAGTFTGSTLLAANIQASIIAFPSGAASESQPALIAPDVINTGLGTETILADFSGPVDTGKTDAVNMQMTSSSADGSSVSATGLLQYISASSTVANPVTWSFDGITATGQLTAAQPGSSPASPMVPETWHVMSLINGWATSGGVNPQYRMIGSPPNSIQIVGNMTGVSASSSTFFQLPSDYRPAHTIIFLCHPTSLAATGQYYGQCDPSGNLAANGGSLAFGFNFNGIIPLDA